MMDIFTRITNAQCDMTPNAVVGGKYRKTRKFRKSRQLRKSRRASRK